MGSVINYIECPRCKQENCIDDYYYRTGEEYKFCPDCGYQRIFRFKRDDDGKFRLKDESKGSSFDNLILEEIHTDDPYGAFSITSISGGGSMGTLETEDDYEKFVSEIISLTNQEHNIKEAVVSKLVGDKIEKEVVF